MRFTDEHGAKKEALELRAALYPWVDLFIASPKLGEDITETCFAAMKESELFIAMATSTYAEDTGNSACTHGELNYWKATMAKRFPGRLIPVNMLREGETHAFIHAELLFTGNTAYVKWALGDPMPAALPDKIFAALGIVPVPLYVKKGVKKHEVEMQSLALDAGVRAPKIVAFDEASGVLHMELLDGMDVSNYNGEGDECTPSEEYEQIRDIMRQLAAINISYPDLTGYNFIRDGTHISVIDFGDCERGPPCEFMQQFLDGHDGWNPDFR